MLSLFLAPARRPPMPEPDPFAHPALAMMTPRELADLPFPRTPDAFPLATSPSAR